MRAARYHGRRDIRLEEVPEPRIRPDEVKLRVAFAGICGSDLHEYYEGPIFTRADSPHPLTGVRNPAILGHELSGEVIEIGAEVSTVAVGDLVAVEPLEDCGRCRECAAGRRCVQRAVHGYTRSTGGFCDFATVKEAMAHKLPAGFDPLSGSLIEPLSVAVMAARRAEVQAGEVAAVHGMGPIGLGVLIALRAAGVDVVAFEPSPVRRDAARRLGAREVVDASKDDPVDVVHGLTAGAGAAASIDCAGVPSTLAACISSTARDRRVVITASAAEPLPLALGPLHTSRVFVTTSTMTMPLSEAFDDAIALVRDGHVRVDEWTETIGLEGLLTEGFEPLHRQEKIKVIVDVASS